jgi:hypothetical protein
MLWSIEAILISAVVLTLVGVGGGMVQLVKAGARDLLSSALALCGGMVVGVALQVVVQGGVLIGVAGGLTLAVRGALRALAKRRNATAAALLEAPDGATSLLIVHDRLDALERENSRGAIRKVGQAVAAVVMGIFGVGGVAMGMIRHSSLVLLIGLGGLFVLASAVGRRMVEAAEADVLRAELHRLRLAIAKRDGMQRGFSGDGTGTHVPCCEGAGGSSESVPREETKT